MTELIWYSLVGGIFSLVGGLVLTWHEGLTKRIMTPLLAFAAGSFLGASFLDILPEAVEAVDEPHPIFIAAIIGFMLFFILERGLMRYAHKGHEKTTHSDHTESLPILVIMGDSIHNFLDGIVIALAYIANPILGLTTTLAVAAHEIPQEIGEFSILLAQGWSKKKVILINIAQSLLTIPGVVIGYYAGQSLEAYIPYLLGGVGGIFIYLAASDLIPEVHHRAGHKHFHRVVWPMLASMLIIGYLVRLAHGSV